MLNASRPARLISSSKMHVPVFWTARTKRLSANQVPFWRSKWVLPIRPPARFAHRSAVERFDGPRRGVGGPVAQLATCRSHSGLSEAHSPPC